MSKQPSNAVAARQPASEELVMTVHTTGVAELYRRATDVAGVCKEIVTRTAQKIQGRGYVRVEGWMAIATAHGCVASIREVRHEPAGIAAVAELRRIEDGTVICSAEGFVGEDEPVWYGGQDKNGRQYERRPEYARRAMASTRAISRVCRSAFAHVVVLMDAGLSTTPAEEIEEEPVGPGSVITPPPAGKPRRGTITDPQLQKIAILCEQVGYGKEHLAKDFPGLVSRTQLSKEQASELIEMLQGMADEREPAKE
jgi:hypothetical protein